MPDNIAAHPVRNFVHDELLRLHQYNFALASQYSQLTAHVLEPLGLVTNDSRPVSDSSGSANAL